MLAVVVLEDNVSEREIIQKMIENRISVNPTPEEYDAEVVLSTGSPTDVLRFIKDHEDDNLLAFLDIDLKTEVDGIEVASRIKSLNPDNQIVFVTADAEALKYTIKRHVAPLDYITKDAKPEEIQSRIYETVDLAYKRYQQLTQNNKTDDYFTYSRIKGIIERIPLQKIYYLELQDKKYGQVRVYAQDLIFDCNGVLKEIEKNYDSLIFVDRDTLINLNNVKSFDYQNGIVYFDEAGKIKHQVSVRRKRQLKKLLQKI